MHAPVLEFDARDHPPEQAWEPFLNWLRSEGLDPDIIRSVVIVGEGLARIEEFVLNDEGHRHVVGAEPVTRFVTAQPSSPPPLHPARGL